MKPQVFLDMDGVICDFDAGYLKHFGWKDSTHASISTWSWPVDKYKEENPGKTEIDFWHEFDFLFWAQLPKTKEADVILGMVKKYQPTILTTVAIHSPGVFDGKASWLRKHLKNYYYEGRVCICTGAKHRIAAPGKLLIDDSQDNYDRWLDAGGEAILVPRPWNSNRGKSVYNEIRWGLSEWEEKHGL